MSERRGVELGRAAGVQRRGTIRSGDGEEVAREGLEVLALSSVNVCGGGSCEIDIGGVTRKVTYKVYPRIRNQPDPLRPPASALPAQLLDLISGSLLRLHHHRREKFDQVLVRTVAPELGGEYPLHVRGSGGFDQAGVEVPRDHMAQGEDQGVLASEGRFEEGGGAVVSCFDADVGTCREGGVGVGAGEDGDVEAVRFDQGAEGGSAEVAACLWVLSVFYLREDW